MRRSFLYIILLVLVSLIAFRNGVTQENPKPDTDIVDIDNQPIVVPTLDTNFVYDDLEKAKAIASTHKRKVIVIFGAEWCPYCKDLKRASKKIKQFKEYIICFLDTDNKNNNSNDINKYRPRSLPTSILIDLKGNELSRKIGYKDKDYSKWLDSLQQY